MLTHNFKHLRFLLGEDEKQISADRGRMNVDILNGEEPLER